MSKYYELNGKFDLDQKDIVDRNYAFRFRTQNRYVIPEANDAMRMQDATEWAREGLSPKARVLADMAEYEFSARLNRF